MESGGILKIVVVSVLYSLLEFLIPSGRIKNSAVTALRLIALLCVTGILKEWVR